VALALVSYASWWVYHVTNYSEWISQISIGDSETKVLAVVGRPVDINTSPNHLWCSEPEISYEYWYGTAVVASWAVIGFNKQGKVICKLELESP
jgi:hypothetical protein